jgi:hypothetical protein
MTTELNLPDSVCGVTKKQALEILQISRPTLIDFQYCCNIERPKGWDYNPNDRGFTVNSLMVLWELRKLVKTLGRPQAQKQIKQHMQEIFNHG